MHLGNSVECPRALDSQVWAVNAGGAWTKGTNCAWAEEFQVVELTEVGNVVETMDVNLGRGGEGREGGRGGRAIGGTTMSNESETCNGGRRPIKRD